MKTPVLVVAIQACALCTHAEEERLSPLGVLEQMKVIQGVGSGGAGNVAATQAWKELSQQNPQMMMTVLRGIDGRNPLADNYFRSLVDALTERALSRNQELPLKELREFLADRRHNPRARRLAYEVIIRAEPPAAERLIPTMLDDPSLELRRDAVAEVLADAEALLNKDKKDSAASLYEKALVAARDEDQIKLASDKLKELGREVDLPRHFGFVTAWKLIGPFDNTDKKGFSIAYAPEKELDFSAEYPGKAGVVKWFDHVTEDDYGNVDLNKAIGKHMGAAAYAVADFYSAMPRDVDLRIGSDCANKIWLNGELIHSAEVYKALTKLDQYIAKGKLKAGRNVVLLKICQNEQTEDWAQDWKFQCRLCDETGTAVLSEAPAPAKGANQP